MEIILTVSHMLADTCKEDKDGVVFGALLKGILQDKIDSIFYVAMPQLKDFEETKGEEDHD